MQTLPDSLIDEPHRRREQQQRVYRTAEGDKVFVPSSLWLFWRRQHHCFRVTDQDDVEAPLRKSVSVSFFGNLASLACLGIFIFTDVWDATFPLPIWACIFVSIVCQELYLRRWATQHLVRLTTTMTRLDLLSQEAHTVAPNSYPLGWWLLAWLGSVVVVAALYLPKHRTIADVGVIMLLFATGELIRTELIVRVANNLRRNQPPQEGFGIRIYMLVRFTILVAAAWALYGTVQRSAPAKSCQGDMHRFIAEWQQVLTRDGSTFQFVTALPWKPPDSREMVLITAMVEKPGAPRSVGSFGGSCNPQTGKYERLPSGQPSGSSGPLPVAPVAPVTP